MSLSDKIMDEDVANVLKTVDVKQAVAELKDELAKDMYSYTFEIRVKKAIDKIFGSKLTDDKLSQAVGNTSSVSTRGAE
jgi:hypothetical protein